MAALDGEGLGCLAEDEVVGGGGGEEDLRAGEGFEGGEGAEILEGMAAGGGVGYVGPFVVEIRF